MCVKKTKGKRPRAIVGSISRPPIHQWVSLCLSFSLFSHIDPPPTHERAHTQNPKPQALNPQPNPKPLNQTPKPHTLHPTPYAPNLKPPYKLRYDDPAIIAGAGTTGLEIVHQVPDVEVVVTIPPPLPTLHPAPYTLHCRL